MMGNKIAHPTGLISALAGLHGLQADGKTYGILPKCYEISYRFILLVNRK